MVLLDLLSGKLFFGGSQNFASLLKLILSRWVHSNSVSRGVDQTAEDDSTLFCLFGLDSILAIVRHAHHIAPGISRVESARKH